MSRLEELRTELRALLGSFEYAYAMGAQRTLGPRDPRLEPVVARVEELEREIAALRASAGEADAR
jgi:hypothetical protein